VTAGWTVPGFTPNRELGSGASGPVVLAVDDATKTQVALRYFSDRLRGDATFMRRFRADAAVLSRLEDPALVDFYEFVEEAGGAAIVMEYVEGVSLRRILATQGPTGPLAAMTVFGGSLLALASAHEAGLVHRAYKPENVLIRSDGQLKVSDLGLLIEAGGSIGAAGYLAPELWAGGQPSPATDLYAATAVFFECLTGRPPYSARKPAELARLHQGAPIPAEAVPGPLQALITHGLAKSPEARPASAADLLALLDDAAVAAYGQSWEGQGRDRLAEMADRAAKAPDPEPERRRSSRSSKAVPAAAPAAPVAQSDPEAATEALPITPPQPRHRVPEPPVAAKRKGRGKLLLGTAAAAIAVVVAVIVVAAVNDGGGGPAAAIDKTATPAPTTQPPVTSDASTAPPAITPAALADKITTALADKPAASFTYRGPAGNGGASDTITASGLFRYTAKAAGAYDMSVGNPGDKRYAKALRTVVVGGTAYVFPGARKAPAARTAAKDDPLHVYAAMAANARWATSPTGLLGILHAGTDIQQSGDTYSGTASLAKLGQEQAVAPFYAPYTDAKYTLSYTLRVGTDGLPERLDVKLAPVSGKGTTLLLHTTYTRWNRKTAITAP